MMQRRIFAVLITLVLSFTVIALPAVASVTLPVVDNASTPVVATLSDGDTTDGGRTRSIAGIGIMIGEPTGISLTFRPSDRTGFDAVAAWSFADPAGLYFHANAHFPFHEIPLEETNPIGLYWGIGPVLRVQADDLSIGLRIPLGATYQLEAAPFEVFAEIAAGMDLYPRTAPFGGGGIGIRYQF